MELAAVTSATGWAGSKTNGCDGGGGSLSGRNPVRRNLAATALDFSTSTMNDPKMDGRRVSCARVKGRYADIFDLCSASR